MNWNRIEFHYGQQVVLRVCDARASRWVPVTVCGVLVSRGNAPQYQIEEADGQLLWADRTRLRTIFENSENSLLTDRQTADTLQHVRRKVRMTETTKTGSLAMTMTRRYFLWELDTDGGEYRAGDDSGYSNETQAYAAAERIAKQDKITIGVGLFDVDRDGERYYVETLGYEHPPE